MKKTFLVPLLKIVLFEKFYKYLYLTNFFGNETALYTIENSCKHAASKRILQVLKLLLHKNLICFVDPVKY